MKLAAAFFGAAVLLSAVHAFSYDKKEATDVVTDAESYEKVLESNQQLGPYIPFDTFRDGMLNVIQARAFLDNRKYDDAHFYGAVARIRFETADIVAQARMLRYQRLTLLSEAGSTIINESTRKKKESTDSKETIEKKESTDKGGTIIYSGFYQKGDSYRAEMYDWQIFSTFKNRKIYKLSSDGKNRLDGIIMTLARYPGSRLKIVGHTESFDVNQTSTLKADAVRKYFLEKNVSGERIEIIGMGNREVTATPNGYRRVSRVEFIISGPR